MNLTFPIRSDKLSMSALVTEQICHEKTAFQTIDIYETEVFGRALLLDGHIQLTTFDEKAYHESLVHIPLMSINEPKSALVIGGGDGGVLRELCRNKSLEHIDMVEIDEGVVRLCREHLPSLSDGTFDDPRVHLHIADAFEFVKTAGRQYDLIVADSTDVYEDEEGALSEQLFTDTFYLDCKAALSDKGILVTQADNLVFCPYSLVSIMEMFARVFPKVSWYQALIPSFGGYSGYCWASKGAEISHEFNPGDLELRYLNNATYQLAFQPLTYA